MTKWLIKKFCPSAKTLAGYGAEGIAKSVNESRKKTRDKIAKIAAYAASATEIANRLAKMVDDGTIDDTETKVLQEMLHPLFDTALRYAFDW